MNKARGTRVGGVVLLALLSFASFAPVHAQSGGMNLAAMTLDSRQMPATYQLTSEGYRSTEQLANALAATIDPATLVATGLLSQYTSYYTDAVGNTIRSYVFAYSTVEDVQRGFDLLETEPVSTTDETYQDLPALTGVGEAPGEITLSQRKESDGTTTQSYDITFRIDRFQVGVAESRYDDQPLQKTLVESLARTFAQRVTDVLAGSVPAGIDYALPNLIAPMSGQILAEGYQTETEAFPSNDPAAILSGFSSAYYRGSTFSDSALSVLPYVGIGIAKFQSPDAAMQVSQNVALLTPSLPLQQSLSGVQVAGGDAFAAFTWATANPDGPVDSIRVMVRSNDLLITVDVQGMPSVADAQTAAISVAALELDCAANGNCNQPVTLGP